MVITNAAFFHKVHLCIIVDTNNSANVDLSPQYYSYLYTYWMPESVREHVQKHLNCEDIAMNFLVSHITRRPPVLVIPFFLHSAPSLSCLSSANFLCWRLYHRVHFHVQIGGMRTPECKSTKKEGLHNSTSHLETRSHCLKDFEAAYGYMPLLTSSFKARSTPNELRCSRGRSKYKYSHLLSRHAVKNHTII